MKYVCNMIYILYAKGSGLLSLSALLFARLRPIEVKNLLNSSTISLSCVTLFPLSTLSSLTTVALDFLFSRLFSVFQHSLLYLLFCNLVL